MTKLGKIYRVIVGEPLDPTNQETRRKTFLIAFLAWVGLGADGLSSSCYGPEQTFLALGQHTSLSLYLAIATVLTVFIISLGYNQVIELFPTGGGGYKVASTLINPYAGLFSGTALLIDYVLTISISIASGVDALFSLLPLEYHTYKLTTEACLILFLVILNLRGLKESVTILMPVFLGFVISHASIIIYGIIAHANRLPQLIPDIIQETQNLSSNMGWIFLIGLLLRAYSLGGATYTGIEAVSNNVNRLTEPRVKTGKWTMFYMATSLSFTAGGLILLYLIWNIGPKSGQTLNAVTFATIMQGWQWGTLDLNPPLLMLLMFFEASLLFVASNTGFIDGPNVLANMATDSWVPSQFRLLSSRLVIRNGIIFMGLVSLAILLWTEGNVGMLVVLYSINVFITFSLSFWGLCRHWQKNKENEKKWLSKLGLSFIGFLVTTTILIIIIFEKFTEGGWLTLTITGLLFCLCLMIKHHYKSVDTQLQKIAEQFYRPNYLSTRFPPEIDPKQPTAIFFVDNALGIGMNTLMRVRTLFKDLYKNFIFLGIGEVDVQVFGKETELKKMYHTINDTLRYFVNYCHNENLPSTSYCSYGTDTVECISTLANKMKNKYPNCTFFSGDIIFENENWITRLLHRDTPVVIQRILHQKGLQVVLLPINLSTN